MFGGVMTRQTGATEAEVFLPEEVRVRVLAVLALLKGRMSGGVMTRQTDTTEAEVFLPQIRCVSICTFVLVKQVK